MGCKATGQPVGNDCMVAPDMVVHRHPCADEEINEPFAVVSEEAALKADLRASSNPKPISPSMGWFAPSKTMGTMTSLSSSTLS
ncbi:NgoMIV family type II restriction endonuclease [Olsenella uli]|uniref:NgoMIV family type II restriction endonuclease n=1 Tax=Olsenella uli TaxID=133926 RepID=UPI003D331C94